MRISNFEFLLINSQGPATDNPKQPQLPGFQIRIPKFGIRNLSALPLRELEALAGALLSILLAFFNARVTCDQARLLQCWTKIRIVFEQRTSNAVANSPRLSRRTATTNIDQNIKLGSCLSQLQRLSNNHTQSLVGKI